MSKQKITDDSNVQKYYKYSIGDIKLDFTLRQDKSDEMRVFVPLLERALEDVKNDLKKYE